MHAEHEAGARPKLPGAWRGVLADQLASPLWRGIQEQLSQARAAHRVIYPSEDAVFRALELTPFDHVKVVILGQDPYHGPNQAMGLSFSVPPGERPPPSLRNIFKELASDLQVPVPQTGDLTPWAKQGVLLLNSILSVEQGQAGSHSRLGWETLTDEIIARLSQEREHLVFVLWGAHAQKKAALIDRSRHLVLASPHPSPLSASRGFFGSRPFSKINAYLERHGEAPIDWRL